jgi:acyl carrier protein
MKGKIMSFERIIKEQIDELTDFDINKLVSDTLIEDIGLASLDFLSIQVNIKRELNIDVDLNALTEVQPRTYGDLLQFFREKYGDCAVSGRP